MQNPERAINQFDVVVHPFFVDAENNLELIRTSAYRRLANNWSDRFDEVAQQPDTLLIYYSSLEDPVIGSQLYEEYRDGWVDEERARIRDLENKLGERVVIFTEGLNLPIKKRPLTDKLQDRGFVWNPQTANMWVYGEFMESCVKGWGKQVKGYLGVNQEHYRSKIRRLSMTRGRMKRIYREMGR